MLYMHYSSCLLSFIQQSYASTSLKYKAFENIYGNLCYLYAYPAIRCLQFLRSAIFVCKYHTNKIQPFHKRQILDSSKLKESADDNFKVHENRRKFCKRIENTVGKGEIARYKQFLLFPKCF